MRRRRCSPRSTGAARTRTARRRRRGGRRGRRTSSPAGTPPAPRSPRRSRHASIWQNCIAPACRNCLNRMRFWQCSPVATPMPSGCRAFAIAAWPSTSSGLVGSSIHQGCERARAPSCARSPGPPPSTWLASVMSSRSGPISSRRIAQRRTSSSTLAPTLILKCVEALRDRLAAEARDLVVVVAEPAGGGRVGGDSRLRSISASRSGLAALLRPQQRQPPPRASARR